MEVDGEGEQGESGSSEAEASETEASEAEASEAEASDGDEEDGSGSEAGSSGSEGETDKGDDVSSGSDEDGRERGAVGSLEEGTKKKRRKRKKKAFVPPPPREMPARTTRANRYGGQVDAEEGDEDFWNQDFFAEEEADSTYSTESEPEDRFDRDFDKTESEDSDEGGERAEREATGVDRKRRKTLKPPGGRGGGGGGRGRGGGRGVQGRNPPDRPATRGPPPDLGDDGVGGDGADADAATPDGGAAVTPSPPRREVRDSTRRRLHEAEEERRAVEQSRPRKAQAKLASHRPLTQAEMLAEAARTEIENTRSLEYMLAFEEETRRRNAAAAVKVDGPAIRTRSRRGVGGSEETTVEVRNMGMPPELQAQVEPEPPPRAVCAVTGLPARYRDPLTGRPYATLKAFARLRAGRAGGGGREEEGGW